MLLREPQKGSPWKKIWRAHHDHLIRNDEKTEFVWENSRGRLFFKKSRAIEASEQVQKRLEKPRFDSKIRLRGKKPNGHFYCRLDQFEAAASSPLSLANNKHPKQPSLLQQTFAKKRAHPTSPALFKEKSLLQLLSHPYKGSF